MRQRSIFRWAIFLGCSFPLYVFAQVGIASKYPRDRGIEADAEVVFAENFESSVSTFTARFTGGGGAGVATSTDRSAASGGVQSVRLIPNGISGNLYTQLPTNYDSLYFRYYVKYLGNVSHHAGAFMGGYYPPSKWPQGDAGLKGIRPNGDRLFVSALEQQGGSDFKTRLDTYNNWIDMQGGSFGGNYYGRNLLVTENLPLRLGTWQCIEMRVKLNTLPTSRDGELQVFLDGVSVQSFKPGTPTGAYDSAGNWVTGSGSSFPGLQWRDVLTYGINWVKIQNYSDVGTPYDVLFDDIVVAKSRIGCIHTGAPSSAPSTPRNLKVF